MTQAGRSELTHDGRLGAARLARPRSELARIQPARAERSARRTESVIGARQVPGDLLVEPRRVLHETDGGDSSVVGRHECGRGGTAKRDQSEAGDDHRDACRTGGLLHRSDPARARRAQNPPRRLGRSHRCTARRGVDPLRQRDLTCLDTAQPRRGSSFRTSRTCRPRGRSGSKTR